MFILTLLLASVPGESTVALRVLELSLTGDILPVANSTQTIKKSLIKIRQKMFYFCLTTVSILSTNAFNHKGNIISGHHRE